MSANLGAIYASIKLNIADLTVNVDRAKREIATLGKEISKHAKGIENAGQSMMLGVSAPLVAIGGAALKMAADAQESENLFTVSMGNMAGSARKWSEQLRTQLGLNSYEVRKNVGTFNVMLNSMGLGEQQAYKMAKGLTKLSYDMASFHNLNPEDAFIKLQAGISGEIEPLKRLGIVINETTVKAYAYANGIAKAGDELTEQQKILARYNLIMSQTSKAQGDLARTMDSPANQLRVLKSRATETAVEFGKLLIPAFRSAVTSANNLAKTLNDLSPAGKNAVLSIAGIAAAIGPLLFVAGKLPGIITGVKTAIAVLGGVSLSTVGIIAGVIAAVYGLIKAVQYLKRDTAAEKQEAYNSAKAKTEQARETKKLVNEYNELSKKTKLSKEEQGRMSEIMSRIRDISPELIKGYNSQGQGIGLIAKAADKATLALENAYRQQVKLAGVSIKNDLSKLQEKQKLTQSAIKYDQSAIEHGLNVGLMTTRMKQLSPEMKAQVAKRLEDYNKQIAKINSDIARKQHEQKIIQKFGMLPEDYDAQFNSRIKSNKSIKDTSSLTADISNTIAKDAMSNLQDLHTVGRLSVKEYDNALTDIIKKRGKYAKIDVSIEAQAVTARKQLRESLKKDQNKIDKEINSQQETAITASENKVKALNQLYEVSARKANALYSLGRIKEYNTTLADMNKIVFRITNGENELAEVRKKAAKSKPEKEQINLEAKDNIDQANQRHIEFKKQILDKQKELSTKYIDKENDRLTQENELNKKYSELKISILEATNKKREALIEKANQRVLDLMSEGVDPVTAMVTSNNELKSQFDDLYKELKDKKDDADSKAIQSDLKVLNHEYKNNKLSAIDYLNNLKIMQSYHNQYSENWLTIQSTIEQVNEDQADKSIKLANDVFENKDKISRKEAAVIFDMLNAELKAYEAMGDAGVTAYNKIKEAIKDLTKVNEEKAKHNITIWQEFSKAIRDSFKDIVVDIRKQLVSAIADWIQGINSFKDFWKRLWRSLLEFAINMIIQSIIVSIQAHKKLADQLDKNIGISSSKMINHLKAVTTQALITQAALSKMNFSGNAKSGLFSNLFGGLIGGLLPFGKLFGGGFDNPTNDTNAVRYGQDANRLIGQGLGLNFRDVSNMLKNSSANVNPINTTNNNTETKVVNNTPINISMQIDKVNSSMDIERAADQLAWAINRKINLVPTGAR